MFLNLHLISRKKSTYLYVFEFTFDFTEKINLPIRFWTRFWGLLLWLYFRRCRCLCCRLCRRVHQLWGLFSSEKKIEIFFWNFLYSEYFEGKKLYFGAKNFFPFYSTIPIVCDIFTRLISQNLIFSFNASSLFQTNF